MISSETSVVGGARGETAKEKEKEKEGREGGGGRQKGLCTEGATVELESLKRTNRTHADASAIEMFIPPS